MEVGQGDQEKSKYKILHILYHLKSRNYKIFPMSFAQASMVSLNLEDIFLHREDPFASGSNNIAIENLNFGLVEK